jgi:2-polyprenyl-6-methoxyphenol hydroxylase-like FAD-dependent oxidoreductase
MIEGTQQRHQQTHAIVIGGSIAGMLTARVLVEHFDRVTIIERDALPDHASPRKGTPQARHLHVLLERGRQIMEQFFPGLTETLISDGASLLDTAGNCSILNPAGWAVQFRSGIHMLTCSRDLLDLHLRRRLKTHPRISWKQGVDVTALVHDDRQGAVRGVVLKKRSQAFGAECPSDSGESVGSESDTILSADFVADASGRGSRAPQWLESLGYGRPHETIVSARMGYATRVFRRPPALRASRQGVFIQAAPPVHTRSGVAVPIEGDRWIVSVSGGDADYPPTDPDGFMDFVRSLRSSAIYDAIKDCEPVSPVFGRRGLDNHMRHFDRMTHWPENFVVLGDAACAFNPVYAQGMASAAMAALALDRCFRARRLRDGHAKGLAKRFQIRLARVVRVPWLLATREDLRYRHVSGAEPSAAARWAHRYMDQVFRVITRSRATRSRSLQVFHLLRHPVTLLHPGNVARVLATAASRLVARSARVALALPVLCSLLKTAVSTSRAGAHRTRP